MCIRASARPLRFLSSSGVLRMSYCRFSASHCRPVSIRLFWEALCLTLLLTALTTCPKYPLRPLFSYQRWISCTVSHSPVNTLCVPWSLRFWRKTVPRTRTWSRHWTPSRFYWMWTWVVFPRSGLTGTLCWWGSKWRDFFVICVCPWEFLCRQMLWYCWLC